MNWLAWRQHRKQFMVAGILFALFAALLIPTGLHFWHTYQQALATCSQTATCNQLSNELFQSNIDQMLFHFIPVAILFLPILLGLFWGVPLLAREYTGGTNKLVWSQSVSRRKWLSVKLVWLLVGTITFAAAFAALNTWWSKTGNALNLNRFNDLFFSTQGIVPVGYAVFAVALGIALGAWFRRTMVALGVTLGLLIAIVLVVVPNFIRPYYMAPITVTAPMGPGTLDAKIPSGSWVISRNIVDKNGKTFNTFNISNMPSQCQQLIQQGVTENHGVTQSQGLKTNVSGLLDNCLNNAGYHEVATHQPSYRYWDFQRIETALYLGLAVIPIGATYWLVVKRDA